MTGQGTSPPYGCPWEDHETASVLTRGTRQVDQCTWSRSSLSVHWPARERLQADRAERIVTQDAVCAHDAIVGWEASQKFADNNLRLHASIREARVHTQSLTLPPRSFSRALAVVRARVWSLSCMTATQHPRSSHICMQLRFIRGADNCDSFHGATPDQDVSPCPV